jgi:DNA polymerase III alpha subunit (gram-positive type)
MKNESGKILVFDIETTDFKGNFGHMLMWSGKFIGQDKIYQGRIDENDDYGTTTRSMIDDSRIVMELRNLVDSSDAVVYHYGDRFDLKFLNTRCLENGMMPPAKVTSIDTWKVARNNLAMTSNRLATLAESFGNGNEKSSLSREQWKLASHGDKEVLDAMMAYCIKDVLATEAIYLRLRPFMYHHPIMHVKGDNHICPACGSEKTNGNGSYRTKHYKVYRQRCTSCGMGFERSREKVK